MSSSLKARALVLDREPTGFETLKAALSGEQVTLAGVRTLEEALHAVGNEPPELVFVVDRGEPPPIARLAQAAPRAWVEVIGLEELDGRESRIHQLVRRAALRRRVQSELTSPEDLARLEEVGSNMPGALFQVVLEAGGTSYFPFISRSIEQLTGVPAEQLVSDAALLFRMILDEDRADFRASQQQVNRSLSTWNHEFRVRARHGQIRWLRGSASPTSQPDGSVLWNGVLLDITERVQAVQDLEHERLFLTAVLDTVAALVLVLDTEGRIVGFNRALEKLTGWTADEVRGRFAWDALINIEAAAKGMQVIQDNLDSDGEVVDYESPLRTKTGEMRTVLWQSTRMLHEDGSIEFMIGTGIDITEKRRLETAASRVDRLESLGVLAGGIAHDFNNLLMGVAGQVSLALRHASPDPQIQECLDQALLACRQATALASQLLTFSTGGEPIKRCLNLNPLIQEVVGFALRGTTVRPEFDLPAEELWSEVDPGQLAQVLHNLATNARQAMPNGGTLTIEAANVDIGAKWNEGGRPLDPGRYVRVAISDEGGGIDPANFRNLFDPWFTTKEEGTGLGLAVAHSVVVRHGGAITVDSVVGQGSTFRIYLPAAEPPEEVEQADSGRNPPIPAMAGRRVLVMDDEELVREVVGAMLIALGHEVAYASDGAQALRSYAESRTLGRPFDVVIMDLTIPGGMGGREAMRLLRETDPDAIVIASSGYVNDGTLANFESEGFRAVLPKPYLVRDLAQVLSEVVP
jgi:PAS domain S-box-containing protein